MDSLCNKHWYKAQFSNATYFVYTLVMSQTKKCVNYLCNVLYKLVNCGIKSQNKLIKLKSNMLTYLTKRKN